MPSSSRCPWFVIAVFCLFGVSSAPAQEKPCLDEIRPLEKTKMEVAQLGGLWGLFERSRPLRPHSMHAIQLDSRINQLLFHLKHLCETLNGIPLNDLARYVTDNLEKKGEKAFREELLVLGKSPAEIDTWIRFAHFAKVQQHRTLDPQSVHETIHRAGPFLEGYSEFSASIRAHPGQSQVARARQMIQDLDTFFEADPNLVRARQEKAQVPYWDFDENHGGS